MEAGYHLPLSCWAVRALSGSNGKGMTLVSSIFLFLRPDSPCSVLRPRRPNTIHGNVYLDCLKFWFLPLRLSFSREQPSESDHIPLFFIPGLPRSLNSLLCAYPANWLPESLLESSTLSLHLLLFAFQTSLTTTTCVAEMLSWPVSSAKKLSLAQLYVPYLLFCKS